MRKIAIYPGTFDPVTSGHIDIIQKSRVIADTLIVAVAADITKTPIFSLEKRVDLIKSHLKELKIRGVEVLPFNGLLVDFAKKNKARIIVRGLRAISDFEYEFMMSCMNSRLNNDIETVFLPASEDTQFISSRFVKEIARLGGDISNFVCKDSLAALKSYYKK